MGIVAYTLWFAGMKRLGTVETSVISMTEPVFATLASLLILRQFLGAAEVLGMAVCLAGVTLFSLSKDGRLKRRSKL
jgi:probable blue pigment (indigoidine) exporter